MELLSNSTPSSRRRNKRSPLGPGAMCNINDAKVNKAINTHTVKQVAAKSSPVWTYSWFVCRRAKR